MAVEVKIPELGESITEVVLTTWHKSDGDWVEKDEDLFEVESDKITTDVPAPESGAISIQSEEGAELEVGAVVATIDPDAEKPQDAGAEEEKEAEGKAEEEKREQKTERGKKEEKKVPEKTAAAAGRAEAKTGEAAGGKPRGNGAVHATSVARRIADDQGIDLQDVQGTGPGGRITKEDVLGASSRDRAPAARKDGEAPRRAAVSAEARERGEGVRREKVSKLRARIAERLVHAKNATAMLTTFNECDMSEVMMLRRQYKEAFEQRHGVGLGFMSFFIKACCSALQQFPQVNAYIDEDAGEIEFHDFIDISIAVSTEKGLTVPILRNAHEMSFAEIEAEVLDLATRARNGKLTMDDLTGGTFTITNGGVFGSLQSTPILNPPQSAILGMHTIKNRPVEDPENPGEIVLRPMMYLALSYDHRIVDGKEAVQFLVHVKECIEDPQRLLLEV